MHDSINRVSSEAVKNATGKTWDEWIELLDNEGARELTHKEIVALLEDKGYIHSEWRQQNVTVGYELVRGSRVIGETAEAGFEIGVQKTFNLPAEQAWDLLTSTAGLKTWLGDVTGMQFIKGQKYRTSEGVRGEIRSLKPGERIRLTWQPADWSKSSTLQFSIIPKKNRVSIRIHHEKLAGETERSQMRDRWREVLERLEKLASAVAG